MSDKRRRRRRASGESSEDEEEDSVSGSDHEYASAAEDSAQEESEVLDLPTDEEKTDQKDTVPIVEADDGGGVHHSDQDDEAGDDADDEDVEDDDDDVEEDDEALTEERGAGDGEEENKKVDDDEDRRNPQYIPKKGMFYEHDDRIDSAEEAENAEKTAAETADKKRVPRSENVEKWGHDKFLEREQQPKSKDELVNTYGYDIRNEDSAPRARRRRRYGRGPNKYTRKWEDEDAYELKTGPGGGSTNGAAGGPNKSENNHPSKSHENTTTKSALPKQSDLEEFPPLEQKKNSKNESKISTSKATDSNNRSTTASRGAAGSRGGRGGNVRGRGGGRHQQADRQSQQAADKKSTRNNPANSANQRLHKEPKPVQSGGQRGQDHHNGKLIDRLEKDFNTKTKLEGSATTTDNKNSKPRMAKDSPRTNRKQMQDQSGEHQQQDNSKPKRYSNTRNRGGGGKSASNSQNNRSQHQDYYEYNDQDNSNKPQQQQQGAPRYINGNNTSANSPNVSTTAVVPSNFVNMNSGSGPPPAAPFIANTVAAGQPPTSAASGFLDPAAIVNYGPPVQFAPVTVPVTVTVPLVSVPGGGAVPAQPHDSQLPVLAPPLGTPTVTTPDQVLLAMAAAAGQGHAEVRGGVTYFNPTAQIAPMVMARQPVNKRPKAAIPIVDPSQVAPSMSPQSSTEGMEAADQLVVGEHQSVNVT